MGEPIDGKPATVALNRSEVRRMHLFDLEQVRHQHEGQEWVPHWHPEWSFGAWISHPSDSNATRLGECCK